MALWPRKAETRGVITAPVSVASDAALGVLGWGNSNHSGEFVNESTATALSAVWRSVVTISSQLASIPLHTYVTQSDGSRRRDRSFLDSPAGPDGATPFEWVERVVQHLVLHGEAFLLHLYNTGGAIVGLLPVHPVSVSVEAARGVPEGKLFKLTLADQTQLTLTSKDMTHIVGPSYDGLRGVSPLRLGANSMGTALAGDRAAANMFAKGALTAGVLVPAPDQMLTPEDVEAIQADLKQYLYGTGNAGSIPIINRVLEFKPWQMTNEDAQFLQSRAFSIEEIARWFGLPLHMLFREGATSNWGTGIAEQNKNFAQYVLVPHGKRLTERLSRLIRGSGRFVEFDFAGLEAGSARDTTDILLAQVNGGLRSMNEARRILNIEPVAYGEEIRVPSGVMLASQLVPVEVASSDPDVEAALALAKAAPSLVQNPGLPALLAQLRALRVPVSAVEPAPDEPVQEPLEEPNAS